MVKGIGSGEWSVKVKKWRDLRRSGEKTNISIASTLTDLSDAAKSEEFILHIISLYFSHTA